MHVAFDQGYYGWLCIIPDVNLLLIGEAPISNPDPEFAEVDVNPQLMQLISHRLSNASQTGRLVLCDGGWPMAPTPEEEKKGRFSHVGSSLSTACLSLEGLAIGVEALGSSCGVVRGRGVPYLGWLETSCHNIYQPKTAAGGSD